MFNTVPYLSLPVIKVRDKQTGAVHVVGQDIHDKLFIDSNGNIQYINLQAMTGTGINGDYDFVTDVQNSVSYENEYFKYIEMTDILEYADKTSIERLKKAENLKNKVFRHLITESEREEKV